MKTTSLRLLGVCVSLFALVSCQKNLKELPSPVNNNLITEQNAGKNEAGINGPNSFVQGTYNIELWVANYEYVPGQYTFVWKVTNTNPGNGSNGTMQNLSHMNFVPGSCMMLNNIISAGYSANGNSWTNFTPSIHSDPSQSCFTGNVFKFDYGTSGSASTYYRIVFNTPQSYGQASAWFKSGRKTGCGVLSFIGIVCPGSSGSQNGIINNNIVTPFS